MRTITTDWEVTTRNKGHVFDPLNKAVCLGVKVNDEKASCQFDSFGTVGVDTPSIWVFFNAKFDCHWYRRLSLWPLSGSIWCCQIAEFILEGQANKYPSLEQAAIKYGLGHKIDVIKTEYWDKELDTTDVPVDVLSDYCIQDVELTYQIYLKQVEQFKAHPKLYKLFRLMCQDLLVLQEMEWNGQVYNEELCKQRSIEIEQQINDITTSLKSIYPDININFGSGDQLSAFLYGGPIFYEEVEHVGFYKNGKPKTKKVEKWHTLPRLVEPLEGSALKKEGFYATNAETLGKLKGPAAKKFVGPLLELARLDKLNGTYYKGIPKKNKEMNWEHNKIHGQFNQVVAVTGRLSATEPNQQNFSSEILDIFVSRYE